MPVTNHYLKSILIGFLIGCFAFLLIFGLQLGAPTRQTIWIDGIYKRKIEWAQSISEPKLVVVGGSSSLFGISCKQLHQALNIPCVNGGTHAGLGIDYILYRAKEFLKPGDTVLLAIAYEFYSTNQRHPSDLLVDYVLSRDPHFLVNKDLSSAVQIVMGVSWLRLLSGVVNTFIPPTDYGIPYKAKSLNRYGDETGNRLRDLSKGQKRRRDQLTPLNARGSVTSSYGMDKIQEFIAYCKQNDMVVLATWPNTLWFDEYEQEAYRDFFMSIRNFHQNLNVPLLGEYREFMYEKAQIFDTIYHLNRSGVRRRTEQLERYLAPYLE